MQQETITIKQITTDNKGRTGINCQTNITIIDLIYSLTALDDAQIDKIVAKNPLNNTQPNQQTKKQIPIPLENLETAANSGVFNEWFFSLSWNTTFYMIRLNEQTNNLFILLNKNNTPEQGKTLINTLNQIFNTLQEQENNYDQNYNQQEYNNQDYNQQEYYQEPGIINTPYDEQGNPITTGLISTQDGSMTITPEEGAYLADLYPIKKLPTIIPTIITIIILLTTLIASPFAIPIINKLITANKYKQVSPLRYTIEIKKARTWALAGLFTLILATILITTYLIGINQLTK